MIFYLGTHAPGWLGSPGRPLFVSAVRLRRMQRWPVARRRWALDSGGFTELSQHGRWTITPEQYVAEVRRARDEVGSLDWAAPQDWMCEPWVVEKTGLSVAEHQRRTIENFLTLRTLAPDLPIVPVLQGWEEADYLRHVEAYSAHGVDLAAEPTVGLGTVCRRQSTQEAENIVRWHAEWYVLLLHAFGVKTGGLRRYGDLVQSADSMAWSFTARRRPIRLEGCTHQTCANCRR